MKIAVRKRKIGSIPTLEVVGQENLYNALPLIVYYHGWQTSKELVLTQGRKLAQQGFRAVLPDAQNHGEREAAISKIPSLTFFQSIHTNLFEFESIVNYFSQLGLTNGKLGVGGVSMGGMTTCALLTQHPEIDVAACVMGSPSLIDYRQELQKLLRERNIQLPKDYEYLTSWIDHYDLASQYTEIKKRPIFFWHGLHDEKIPFDQTDRFVRNHLGPELTFHAANERHMVKVPTMDQVAEFFATHL
ncbi:alpha/beta fold hydrolase [Tetragenococcus koreensis]|uniref:AB hydrolase-1 domain-containing protein n=1 Tax=Tetragenococcus koreensis TaxID=290335 RepID=A0AAN4ZRH1_9ENTE|nr:alpha/beta fold hydrolase [Tetragenococcus koreensis]AYW46065.1 esterase [Tetragenococcus koreensis]MCF1584777.1 alpha/beta fold hydrolase [Tetragenococcus koreensis]MCF1614539.1 alpha/beta fold hydrolase [Tetragenococcus koreensis]MCF1616742.1 alpha/beta fold hydrolase [Tetragenococcus koreensis]MCF1620432.1 alpha/beta fold hydrolase [Tetragenococcus koreensis]